MPIGFEMVQGISLAGSVDTMYVLVCMLMKSGIHLKTFVSLLIFYFESQHLVFLPPWNRFYCYFFVSSNRNDCIYTFGALTY